MLIRQAFQFNALYLSQNTKEMWQIIKKNVSSFPFAVGVNNHMGSRFTESRENITETLKVFRDKGFFFIDSFTSCHSIAFDTARQLNMTTAFRDVFIDNRGEKSYIYLQLLKLKKHALKHGYAIGIGHPRPETVSAVQQFIDALEGTQCKLLDTRKTTPGYRVLEKNAVLAGGGNNHRMGLFDSILIKDNHISAYGSITNAVKTARKNAPKNAIVEVECENLDQVNKAISAGAQMLLLDNMSCPMMAQAVSMTSGNVLTEASGGIHIDNIRQVAQTGVDYVSVGAITHSAPAIDISLELKKL